MPAKIPVAGVGSLGTAFCPALVPATQSLRSHVAFHTLRDTFCFSTRLFSTTRVGARKAEKVSVNPKMQNLEEALKVTIRPPPPLRMDSMRYMRHWTIHRAWLLLRRKQREQRERVLMQQYQSMHRACEELRHSSGPGLKDTGYLYRVAMEKKGVYGHDGIPIEYARAQTETPAHEAWNHGWKR